MTNIRQEDLIMYKSKLVEDNNDEEESDRDEELDDDDDDEEFDSDDYDSVDESDEVYFARVIGVNKLAQSVIKLFTSRINAIGGYFSYSRSLVGKETSTIIPATDISFYRDAMNVIDMVEKKKLSIDDLIKLYPEPGKSNDFATHPYALKYISYDDALKLFAQFHSVKNEVGRLFIVLQFLIYFHDKKDKNIEELIAFGAKVEADTSEMVRTSGPILFKHFQVSFFNYLILDNNKREKQSEITNFISHRKIIENRDKSDSSQREQQSKSKAKQQQQQSSKIQRVTPIITQDTIIREIIGYTLMAHTFLQDLLPEKQSKIWKQLMVEMSSILFSLALVSKQFFTNVGRVLESIDWTRRFPNKFIKGQINYDKPFCLFKKVPSSIRYDALIRTTPYQFVNQVFSGVTSLTIVGDMLQLDRTKGAMCNDNYYDIAKPNFVTYPPVGSMPNLTKLVVVGRAFKYLYKHQSETGGLYLLKYLIANTGCKLEHFECIEQLSLDYQPEFDISVFQCLLVNHKSTLMLFKLKRTINKNIKQLTALNTIVRKLKRYQSKFKFKLEFYDSSVSNNATKDIGDSYKPVKEFKDLKLLQKIDNNNNDDVCEDNDDFEDDSFSDL
ncbi:hypothetical protein PPL_03425 [Heterostelium album PN500]|uniref:Uncharacterized protein n=1 Tax=Heterostelium pallidum (strain ATCC 26659 / Pp 5 / PN500) TaxID=670386 RepID=D3B4U9_HETP5|nr:hypothetical protein PPL_03425 [Heterostelium album PN500]EFA84347.1 hypothetical protein PPL_03425 [Heterostelium album PN500]|eukprot:XP_020436462.1 hypothetical protein PPL_03425 [Heterostelium album PN500]